MHWGDTNSMKETTKIKALWSKNGLWSVINQETDWSFLHSIDFLNSVICLQKHLCMMLLTQENLQNPKVNDIVFDYYWSCVSV